MEAPLLHLALVGTPNSGKTSLFNALTGSRQKVANYPGVTVERKAGMLHTVSGHRVDLIDLPGTYSLRGRSPDEEITRDMVLGRTQGEALPDLVLCVADATNLRLTIRLALELKSTGRPLLLVLSAIEGYIQRPTKRHGRTNDRASTSGSGTRFPMTARQPSTVCGGSSHPRGLRISWSEVRVGAWSTEGAEP
jgi:ferrous iron transport protein B